MSTTNSSHKDDVACPDPSVHSQFSRDSELQNSASKAALLAAESKKTAPTPKADFEVLGPDGKLSSAGAATSLKYAKAQDLPGFPSVGIDTTSSGNKAANLAAANHKSFEYWKPETSSSAGKAALLAANSGGKVDLWQYKADGTGHSAASIAMGKNSSPQLDYGYTAAGHKNSLLAATKSLRISDTPVESIATLRGNYPDSANASSNALNAATVAHRPSAQGSVDNNRMSERAMEASRVHHIQNVSRDMYGEKPPVLLEQDEKTRQAALRASAVSMAKSLYEIEKPAMERIAAGDSAARRAHSEHLSTDQSNTSTEPSKVGAMNYLKIQEAAQKLAAERLAKFDPDGVMAYREHYGYGEQQRQSKITSKGSRHRRSGSTMEYDSDEDEAQAARIKNQQSIFNQQVSAVEIDRRKTDRANLLAAAQRSVSARMHDLDERVFADTGKVSPAMMAEWEAKARAKAAADSEERMLTHGKVHIGGGRYMDQSEIDAIAAARMQPTIDELNTTAELQRTRDAEIKADQQRRAEEKKREKERLAEEKRLADEQKAEQKRIKADEKAEAKRLKEEEKARAAEEKRMKKEGKQRETEEQKREAEAEKEARAREIEAEKEAKAQEEAQQKEIKDAETEAERLHNENEDYALEAEKARAAEAEAAERERLATERIEEAERELAAHPAPVEDDVPRESVETTVIAPDRALRSTSIDIDTAGPATETAASPSTTTTTTTAAKRESRFRGLFSRISRSSKGDGNTLTTGSTAEAEKFKSGTGEAGDSEELTARAKGKEPEVAAPSLNGTDDVEQGRTSVVSNDQWEEARDKFDDDLNAPTIVPENEASTGTAAAAGSKFQEEL